MNALEANRVPEHFTRLKPFAAYFEEGTPALMYHKLGPRPSRARLKGLYVSAALFELQTGDLRAAGFETCTMRELTRVPPAGARRVALTFDDGFENVLRHGLEPLARHGLRAIQFLVANRLGGTNEWEQRLGEVEERLMDPSQIREWLAAGHEIGSHTLTHPFLTQIAPDEAREEIVASRRKLEDLFGVPIRHFCYPYGDLNDQVRAWVAEAGYETACTTEFGLNDPQTPAHALKRITARHRSLKFATAWRWFKRTLSRSRGR